MLREVRSSCVTHTHASLQIQSLFQSIYSVNVLHYFDLVIDFNKQKTTITTTTKIPGQVLLITALPDNYLGRDGETVVIQVKKIIFVEHEG